MLISEMPPVNGWRICRLFGYPDGFSFHFCRGDDVVAISVDLQVKRVFWSYQGFGEEYGDGISPRPFVLGLLRWARGRRDELTGDARWCMSSLVKALEAAEKAAIRELH